MEAGVEVPKVTQLIRGKARLLTSNILRQKHAGWYAVLAPVGQQ